MSEHTPTPWTASELGVIADKCTSHGNFYVCSLIDPDNDEDKANGDFIALACNSHDDLLAFARSFREWWANNFDDFDRYSNGQLLCLDNDAEAAIAEATP